VPAGIHGGTQQQEEEHPYKEISFIRRQHAEAAPLSRNGSAVKPGTLSSLTPPPWQGTHQIRP
jgi:hypothetical protein